MEGAKGLLESVKEFIWDILGYFIPGVYVIILLSVIITPKYFLSCPLLTEKDKGLNLIIVILAYILGYVIYGIGEIKEKLHGDKSYMNIVQDSIRGSSNYIMASELLQKKLDGANITTKVANLKMKEVRNLAMSYVPDSDKKVYTFMFRADLSRHIANTSILIGTMAILITTIHWFNPNLDVINWDSIHFILYILLVVSFFILNTVRDRFYKIAMSIPFTIFISFYNK
jgi:hypothetical protein